MTDAPMRTGILVKTYPKVSETFILEEILGLERLGLPLHIYSLSLPTDNVFHRAGERVQARISYVPSVSPRTLLSLLADHARLLFRHPFRYLDTCAYTLRTAGPGRLWQFLRAGALAALCRRHGITHLHTHFISDPTTIAELVRYFTGLPFSISAHAKDIYLSAAGELRRKMAAARFTVTCTEYNLQHLAAIAASGTRVQRMYHGIDLGRFCPDVDAIRDKATVISSHPLLLSVGRLREKKGFPTLIAACRKLMDAGIAFDCRIVGYGPEQERLQHLIDTQGLTDRVQLLGKLTQDEVIRLYRSATMFVLPCRIASDGDRDGIPNVLLEAMAMALPVISTPISGIPEVVEDHQTGLLVPPGDASALATAMLSILTQTGMGQKLGQAARARVSSRFSNEINVLQLSRLILEELPLTVVHLPGNAGYKDELHAR